MDWMETIRYGWSLAERIPPSFWGVVIGSAGTMWVARVTNKAADRRFLAQLEHDRFLKQKERDLALKKDVFLDAAAAVQQAISVLGMTNDVSLENADISKIYREKLSAIAKLQVIASMDTIKALGMFSTHAAGSFVDLMAKRTRALQTAVHIKALDTVIAGQQGQVDSMLERMKQFNLSGRHDPREWSAMESQTQFSIGQVEKLSAEKAELQRNLLVLQGELTVAALQEMQAAAAKVPALLAAVRDELNLPFDLDEYSASMRNQMAASTAKVRSVVDARLASLEAHKN